MLKLPTARLLLVAGTAELGRAELEDRERFAQLLGAKVPEDWPPPLHSEASTRWFVEQVEANADAVGWIAWYFLLEGRDGCRTAVGIGGFTGLPDAMGTVEIGYSIMEANQGLGLATECVAALMDWAFAAGKVERITAQTMPDLAPSIRVLEKSGFTLVGEGSEPGVILYEHSRSL